jgi:tripartite-type tricarboxylate transporter receptor subunit TctC
MSIVRRRFLRPCIGIAALAIMPRIATAQAYPTRPVRLVVGQAAAGAQDILARLLAQWLSGRTGQQFIVENKPGAGTNLAAEAVVRAPADGYTVLLVGAPNAINATLYDQLNFDFIHDIAAVGSFVRTPEVLVVHPSLPAKDIPELIAYAKAHPGKISAASPGIGSGPHMSLELLKSMAGIDMVHVPYRGGGQAIVDLLGGEVHANFTAPLVAFEYIRAGRLRALAVTTASRVPALPEVPSLSDFLPGYDSGGFFGLGAPRGTPAAVIERLNRDINAAIADSDMDRRLAEMAVSPLGGSPDDFNKLIAEETAKWAKVIRSAGIKAS